MFKYKIYIIYCNVYVWREAVVAFKMFMCCFVSLGRLLPIDYFASQMSSSIPAATKN